jgi:hypothetical protein
MAKYVVVLEAVASFGNLRPKLTREALEVGVPHWKAELDRGYKALYFQFGKIHSINGHTVPEQWLHRREGRCADVVLVRGECVVEDFEVQMFQP